MIRVYFFFLCFYTMTKDREKPGVNECHPPQSSSLNVTRPLPENHFFFSLYKLIQSEIHKLLKNSLKYVRNTLERLLPARSVGKNYLNHVLPGLGIFFLFYLFLRPLSEAEMQKITTETLMPFVSRQGSAQSQFIIR